MRDRTTAGFLSRRRAAMALVAASLIAWGSPAFAQHAVDAGSTSTVRPDASTSAERPLHAAIRRAAALAETAPSDRQPAKAQNPNWVVRHPVITGAAIGSGVGFVLSRSDSIGGLNHDPSVALIGTAVGAWGGLIASAVHKSGTGQKVGAGKKIGIIAGAVGLIVVPVLACYGAGGCGGSS
jgi:hypothetical protein